MESGSGVVVGDANLADGNGNLVYDNGGYGIVVQNGPATVAGNTVYGQTTNGYWGIYGYDDVNITSNVVYANSQGISDSPPGRSTITASMTMWATAFPPTR